MCREVDAHEVALLVETLDGGPLLHVLGHLGLGYGVGHAVHAEEGVHGLCTLGLHQGAVADEDVEETLFLGILGKVVLALHLGETVETARECQTLEVLTVTGLQVDALHKVVDALVGTVGLALADDGLYGSFAHTLHTAEAEADVALGIDRELKVTLVHVGTQHVDAHSLALVHELGDFVDAREVTREVGSHVLGWVVGLEVGGLIGYPGVAGGVALVEGVGSKLLPVAPNLVEYLGVVPVLLSALDELGLHLVYDVLLLLTHGLTQGVRLTTGEVGQLAREEHHLLLVYGDTVGVLEVLLHTGNVVLNGLAAVLTVNEVGDVVHRTRTVQRVHGDEVLEGRGLQLAQVLLHTGRLELERTDGLAFAIELVGLGVINGYGVNVDIDAKALLDVGHGLLDDGEGLQSQEVHLDEARVLNHATLVLCYEQFFACLLVFGGAHGYPVGDVVAADDGSAGMYACAAHITFEHLGILDGVAQDGVGRCLGLL